MADGGGHAAHLAVAAFGERQLDPRGRHVETVADRRIPRREIRLGVEKLREARQRLAVGQHDAAPHRLEVLVG